MKFHRYATVLSWKFEGFEHLPSHSRAFSESPHWVHGCSKDGNGNWSGEAWAADKDGNSWRLRICPNDRPDGCSKDMISLALDKEEKEDNSSGASTKLTFVLRDAMESVVEESTFKTNQEVSFHHRGFVERKRVLDKAHDILLMGALRVDIIIEPELKVEFSRVSSPKLLANNMLRMLEDEAMTDLSFEFSDCCYFAHRLVLTANAPLLASLFEDAGAESIAIKGTSSEAFRHVLRYIYGGGPPEKDFIIEHGMEVIDAANKFGVVGLKLESEATLVKSRTITAANVVEYFLFADAKNCALLKEYALSLFTARFQDALESESYLELGLGSPKLLCEVMMAVAGASSSDGNGFRSLSVVTLLKMLEEKGLDMDGSKEMMVSRLESSD